MGVEEGTVPSRAAAATVVVLSVNSESASIRLPAAGLTRVVVHCPWPNNFLPPEWGRMRGGGEQKIAISARKISTVAAAVATPTKDDAKIKVFGCV